MPSMRWAPGRWRGHHCRCVTQRMAAGAHLTLSSSSSQTPRGLGENSETYLASIHITEEAARTGVLAC